MRPTVRGNRIVAVLLVLLVFALAALAGLQYRWINRVSEADRNRRHEAADFVARRIADNLRDEVHRTFEAFLGVEGEEVWPLYDGWMRGATWPDLLRAVYVADRAGTQWTLHRLDARDGLIEAPWPRELESMRAKLATLDPRGPEPRWPVPLFAEVPGLFIVQRPSEYTAGLREVPLRVVMVQFDKDVLTRTVMPALIEQLSGKPSAFEVSVIAENGTVLYRSNPSWNESRHRADASAIVPPAPRELGDRRGPPREEGRRKEGRRRKYEGEGPDRPVDRPVNKGDWQVLVRYRAGGLDELVASTRRRNLAVGGAILAILGAGVAVLVLLVRRADRLRAQEAAFVSVMSHELNTPVAVLRSAGENLKDGIVANDQVSVYGDTIVQEADRLKHMIAEVLELAGMQARTEARPLRTVAVAPIVESAVERCRLVANGQVTVEADIEPSLPPVAADDEALGRAIQNLIVNAIRHGGTGGWVGVRVRRDGKRVTITVEDRGPGIHADDFDQIFEPFYRGRDSANVSGAGLGLTIVKQIAIDHGGSVTLDRRDAGAAFTIHLPAEVRGA